MSARFLPSGDEMLISHEVRFKEDLNAPTCSRFTREKDGKRGILIR